MFVNTAILFADFGANVGKAAVNLLAIAGAGALGYGVILGLVWLIFKALLHKQPPRQVARILAIVGGVGLAVILAGFLFEGAGGGGGWFGIGFGTGTGSSTTAPAGTTEKHPPASSRSSPVTTARGEVTGRALRIRMLGGDKARFGEELRFYQPLPGVEAYNLDKLKPLIKSQMAAQADRPALKEIVIVIEPDSVAHNHEAVRALEGYARDQGLTVTVQRPGNP